MILDLTIFPVLTTGRLTLRRLGMNDAPEIKKLRSDKRVNEYLDRPGSITTREAKEFIQKIEKAISNNESAYWAITLTNEDKLIGTICYWNISLEKEMAEIGYELHPDFQGKGIMQEAILSVLKYGFDIMKIKTITALPLAENKKSIQVLLKNHFREDATNKFVSKEEANGLAVYYLVQ